MTGELAEFRSAPLGGAQVVWAAGELDLSNHWRLERAVEAARSARPEAVVVDLSGVLYLDSIAIRSLIVLSRGEIPLRVVVPPTALIRDAIEVIGLQRVLSVHTTLEEAVTDLAA